MWSLYSPLCPLKYDGRRPIPRSGPYSICWVSWGPYDLPHLTGTISAPAWNGEWLGIFLESIRNIESLSPREIKTFISRIATLAEVLYPKKMPRGTASSLRTGSPPCPLWEPPEYAWWATGEAEGMGRQAWNWSQVSGISVSPASWWLCQFGQMLLSFSNNSHMARRVSRLNKIECVYVRQRERERGQGNKPWPLFLINGIKHWEKQTQCLSSCIWHSTWEPDLTLLDSQWNIKFQVLQEHIIHQEMCSWEEGSGNRTARQETELRPEKWVTVT